MSAKFVCENLHDVYGISISPATLYGYENNYRQPNTSVLIALCDMYDLDITEVYGISDYSKSKIKDASIAFKYDKEDEVFMSASHESEAFLNFSKEMGYVFKPYNGPEHEDCLLLDRKSINVHWLKSNEYERLEESVIAFYKFQVTELIQKLKDEEDSKDKDATPKKE